MQKPLEIRFHQMDASPAVEARIREKAAVLERFADRITSCRVVVERDHQQHHKGNLFRVRLDIGLPGREIAVTHDGSKDHAHEDVYVAIRDAFRAATRQLEDHVRKRRGKVKAHEVPLHGRVVKIDPGEGFGFIETSDGREVYFHRNSVVNGDFETVGSGSEVRLVIDEREGEQGPQATTVQLIGKHHVQDDRP